MTELPNITADVLSGRVTVQLPGRKGEKCNPFAILHYGVSNSANGENGDLVGHGSGFNKDFTTPESDVVDSETLSGHAYFEEFDRVIESAGSAVRLYQASSSLSLASAACQIPTFLASSPIARVNPKPHGTLCAGELGEFPVFEPMKRNNRRNRSEIVIRFLSCGNSVSVTYDCNTLSINEITVVIAVATKGNIHPLVGASNRRYAVFPALKGTAVTGKTGRTKKKVIHLLAGGNTGCYQPN